MRVPPPASESRSSRPPRRFGHDIVDNVQAEPGAALVAPCGEERIEGTTPHVKAHPDAIVGKNDLDIFLAGLTDLNIDDT